MSDWRLIGSEWRGNFESDLYPRNLVDTLNEYQMQFGEEFTLNHLLKLEELRVKARLAEAIADFPELLMDQIGIAGNSYNFHSIARALEDISQSFETYVQNKISE